MASRRSMTVPYEFVTIDMGKLVIIVLVGSVGVSLFVVFINFTVIMDVYTIVLLVRRF